MKRTILLILLLMPFVLNAQDHKIDGGNIVVSKVVDNIDGTKDEIYGRVKSYFTHSYGDANSVIQIDDKEAGLVVGKGLYSGIASFAMGAWQLKAYHILRVDIQDGRARIICSATTIIPNSSAYLGNEFEYRIVDYAPITDKRAQACTKKVQKEAFNNLVASMNGSVISLEKAIKDGGILSSEQEEW